MTTNRLIAAGLVLGASAFGLSGCAEIAMPAPVAAETKEHPALDAKRVETVNTAIFDTLKEADNGLNVELMKTRLTGPAAEARSFAYKKKSILGDANSLDAISSTNKEAAVTRSDVYPRLLVDIMEAPEGANLQMLDLAIQAAPRDNWLLWGALTIHPGATFPAIATGEKGATVVEPDEGEGLVASPNAVVDAYIKAAQSEDTNGLAFADDQARSTLHSQAEANRSALEENGTVTLAFARGGTGPYSVRTAEGGALVFAELNYTLEYAITKEGATASLAKDHDITLLARGNADERLAIDGKVVSRYTMPVALVVPPADAEDKTIRAVASAKGTPFSVEVNAAEQPEEGNEDE